jgi:hypothetical protein
MTTRVESVIFGKFDMADDKLPASGLILLTHQHISNYKRNGVKEGIKLEHKP